MKKFVWPLLVIFFLLGGLAVILIGQVPLTPQPQTLSVQEISQNWFSSGHANFQSESFTHWDEDVPPVVPVNCAKCHSAYGYLDFLGQDGTAANVVDHPANIGSVLNCYVCHSPAAHAKETATFPSGVQVTVLNEVANCVECHQARRAGTDVTAAVDGLAEDEVSDQLSFVDVHYKVGGAVRYGADVMIGYQYPGLSYDGFYPHVPDYQQCTDCHDPHALAIDPQQCAACHPEVHEFIDVYAIRMETPDYDGDGDRKEGVFGEVDTVHNILLLAIQQYANDVLGNPIVYSSTDFPYWFVDTNGNSIADQDEISRDNAYTSWSPRLLKAAYNYHLVVKDPGGFMHNARYLIQIMYDSIADISTQISFDMKGLIRPR